MFDFSIITSWIHQTLTSVMPEGLAVFIECVVIGVCIVALYAILAILLIYMERKVCGFFQCRLGPNRVGKWGSIQVLCDVLKMLTKEIIELTHSDQFLYGWFIFKGHIPALIAFVIYLIAGNAECNRGPFDLPEAESELTAGYHTEYSGMHFGFFYLAEYLNMFIVAAVAATIFLGGWMPLHIVGLDGFNAVMDYIPGFIWFFGKAFFVVFLLMWIKWTFPRLRIDQILNLEWKYLVPISMVNLVIMVLIVVFGLHF